MKDLIKIIFANTIITCVCAKKSNEKKLLIVRLDAIGDYVLFRNFLEEIRKSKNYDGYKITLCGNEIWRDLFESFDSSFVDQVIWVNIKKLRRNPLYMYKLYKQIHSIGISDAINPMYSRTLESDLLIKASGAKIKIGWSGTENNLNKNTKKSTDKIYSQLYSSNNRYVFEFNRNKEFIEKLLGEKSVYNKPILKNIFPAKFKLPEAYIVFFIGASSTNRQWDANNFAKI